MASSRSFGPLGPIRTHANHVVRGVSAKRAAQRGDAEVHCRQQTGSLSEHPRHRPPPGGFSQLGEKRRASVAGQVAEQRRGEHDHRLFARQFGQKPGRVGGGVAGDQSRRGSERKVERAPQSGERIDLLRPMNASNQARASGSVTSTGFLVDAKPAGDPWRSAEQPGVRVAAAQLAADHDRGYRSSLTSSQAVAIAVEQQVEPGAGADLDQGERYGPARLT